MNKRSARESVVPLGTRRNAEFTAYMQQQMLAEHIDMSKTSKTARTQLLINYPKKGDPLSHWFLVRDGAQHLPGWRVSKWYNTNYIFYLPLDSSEAYPPQSTAGRRRRIDTEIANRWQYIEDHCVCNQVEPRYQVPKQGLKAMLRAKNCIGLMNHDLAELTSRNLQGSLQYQIWEYIAPVDPDDEATHLSRADDTPIDPELFLKTATYKLEMDKKGKGGEKAVAGSMVHRRAAMTMAEIETMWVNEAMGTTFVDVQRPDGVCEEDVRRFAEAMRQTGRDIVIVDEEKKEETLETLEREARVAQRRNRSKKQSKAKRKKKG